ncbi:MAG: hypothetical protein CMF49_07950 [Legionellales bacterium]|nr:hypothetical protein [Legionellales bacterium]|tara:strand:+ start:2476 stop:5478 length:3003 start_codon:yes stop_codon:yes gene_type:complete
MAIQKRKITIDLLLALGFSVFSIQAQALSTPRVILEAGSGVETYGFGDLLVPIVGDNTEILYLDGAGKYATDDAWYGSLGVGARKATDVNQTIGAYLFADRDTTTDESKFTVLDAGLEYYINAWDLHVNGYLPISNKENVTGTAYADELGVESEVDATGHDLYASQYDIVEEVGNGADVDVGYTLKDSIPFMGGSRFDLGGYYTSYAHADNLEGVQAGVWIPLTKNAELRAADSYDNIFHNSATLSLAVHFGDDKSKDETINHLLEQNVRHLGTLNTGSGIKSVQSLKQIQSLAQAEAPVTATNNSSPVSSGDGSGDSGDSGSGTPEYDNVWFFTDSGGTDFDASKGTDNCTASNPCNSASFNQTNIDTINSIAPNSNFFFTSGSYSTTTYQATSMATTLTLILDDGQSIYGRDDDYLLPASDDDRPTFYGSFDLLGDNTLDDINVDGTGTDTSVGIYATNTQNITLENVSVSNYTATAGADAAGIAFDNVNAIGLNNVVVENIQAGDGADGIAEGNGNDNAGGVAGNGTQGESGIDGGNATGIRITNSDNVTLNTVTVQNIQAGNGGDGGNGGQGGNADSDPTQQDASHDFDSGMAGTGGDGGNGGNGGQGGNAVGINIQNSTVTMHASIISNIQAGNGGNAGDGGEGGHADTQYGTYYDTTTAGIGGDGGNGGIAGNGGEADGITSANDNLTINNLQIETVIAGNGGIGGNGGAGGNADVTHNQFIDNETLLGGKAGDGGNGGDAGNGGNANGIKATADNNDNLTALFISTLNGGEGGDAGNGGNGGSSDIDNNIMGTGFDVQRGIAGNGGSGGVGGNGGQSYGVNNTNNTVMNINDAFISNFNGGNAGDGGNGGDGGNADVDNDYQPEIITAGKAGDGGAGGNGAAGGNAIAVNSDQSSSTTTENLMTEKLTGGNFGYGGYGGSGGSATTTNNIGTYQTGTAGSGAIGGESGQAGTAQGTGANVTGTDTVENNIQAGKTATHGGTGNNGSNLNIGGL